MFMWKLRKPFESIFDLFPTMKFWNVILGIACFTSVKRADGVNIHFADKGDQIFPKVVTVFAVLGCLMMFITELYPMDSSFDGFAFKCFYASICWSGNICRLVLSVRIKTFLRAFDVIEEVDQHLRKRNIHVDYEECRTSAKTAHKGSLLCLGVGYFIYFQKYISDEDRIYHFIFVCLCSGLSLYTLCMASMYLVVIALTIKRRFEILTEYLVELKRNENSRILMQELTMISVLHMKLCQSWDCAVYSLGSSLIGLSLLFHFFCIYPLIWFEYMLVRLKKEAAPIIFILFPFMYKLLIQLQGLKISSENMTRTVIEFGQERGFSEPILNEMCITLLLQMTHVEIKLILGGFFVFDLESFLIGIKSTSTMMMFILQMNNKD